MPKSDALEAFKLRRQAVREQCDLVELIAPHIAAPGLARNGREYKGLCPFHADHTPSFYIIPAKRIYHCFGCGASGDAITFAQKAMGFSHSDAVNHLAQRLGIMAVNPASPLPPPKPMKPAPERDTREEERRRASAIRSAQELWEEAGRLASPATVARALEYVRARGIDPALLPGGTIPHTLRVHPACEHIGEHGARSMWPALLGCFGPRKGEITAVQRIYLDREGGTGGKAPLGEGTKKGMGSFSAARGGAVRLSRGEPGGLLVLCEGIETGLAVLAAMRAAGGPGGAGDEPAVWSMVSTAGYQHFDLRPEFVNAEGEQGVGFRRVLIAADWNKIQTQGHLAGERAGTFFAAIAGARIRTRWPEMPVAVAPPTHAVVPTLIGPDGEAIKSKAVDWLDVLNELGAEAAGRALWDAAPPSAGDGELVMAVADEPLPPGRPVGAAAASSSSPTPAPSGDGGEPPVGGSGGGSGDDEEERPEQILGVTRTERAKVMLEKLFKPDDPTDGGGGGGSCWRLRRYAGRWWVYGASGAWVEIEDADVLHAEAGLLFDQYHTRQANGAIKLWAPSGRNIEDVFKQAVAFTAHSGQMPGWSERHFDAEGKPKWKSAARFGRASTADQPIRPEAVVATRAGLLDTDEWVAGRVRLLPPTPRWFARACLDVPLTRELLGELAGLDDAAANALIKTHCPHWSEFLQQTFEGSDQLIDQLQRWFGYCLVSDIELQKILWLQGSPGSGKGTIREALSAVVGEANVAMTTIDGLAGRFDLGSFVGRSVVFLPEVRVGYRTDSAQAMDRLLSISGGDPQPVEDKFAAKQPNVRMTCKFVVTPNEEPKFNDAAAALIRRLLVIPTGKPVRKPDPKLPARIRGELLGLVLWSLQGLKALRRDGGFTQPQEGLEILDSVRRTLSPAAAFVDDECVVQAGSEVKTTILFQQFKAWCERGDLPNPSAETFGRQLRAAVALIDRADRQQTDADGEKRWKVYTGVRPRLPGERSDNPYTPRAIEDWPFDQGATAEAVQWQWTWGHQRRVREDEGGAVAGGEEAEAPAPF